MRLYRILITFSFFAFSCTNVSNEFKTNNEINSNVLNHIKFLSSDEMEGRYPGSEGSTKSADYIAENFNKAGLYPFNSDNFYQKFEFKSGISLSGKNSITINNNRFKVEEDYIPVQFSESGNFKGQIIFTGYGLKVDELNWNDYKDIDVEGKWVLMFRGSPEGYNPHSKFGDNISIRKKTLAAKDLGALGVLLINQEKSEPLINLTFDYNSKPIGIPVLNISYDILKVLSNEDFESIKKEIDKNEKQKSFLLESELEASIDIKIETVSISNVVGVLRKEQNKTNNNYIVIGAHFDHLGYGSRGSGSLAPGKNIIHNGADDNASGTAVLIDLAYKFSKLKKKLNNDIIFVAFNAEEQGLLGSKFFVDNIGNDINNIKTMINLDMIGRMKNNQLTIGGIGTAEVFGKIVDNANKNIDIDISKSASGQGPSDHSSFYNKNIPVLFFHTGGHDDYHKPSDDWTKINVEGINRINNLIFNVVYNVDSNQNPPVFKATTNPPTQRRMSFSVTFGIMPNYGDSSQGLKVDAVRENGPAYSAGMQDGDIIVKINNKDVSDIYEYMARLGELKPGDIAKVQVLRNNKNIMLEIQL